MLDTLKGTLARLRRSLSAKADQAYRDRDARGATDKDKVYAEGEGHAYGVASDEVRIAQDEGEKRGP